MNLFEFVSAVFADIPADLHLGDARINKAISLTSFMRHLDNLDDDLVEHITGKFGPGGAFVVCCDDTSKLNL